MPLSKEFTTLVNLKYEDAVSISQSMILDRQSELYNYMRNTLVAKMAALKKMNDDATRQGRRRRLVIPYVLDPHRVHDMVQQFGEFELVFRNSEHVDGALMQSVTTLMVEKMFNYTRNKWKTVICFGISLNHLIIHNRHYAHLCVPSESVEFSCKAIKEDRAMCAILNAARERGRPFPMMNQYARGDLDSLTCADPVNCAVQSHVAVMSLFNVDTNYSQLCAYMMAHGVQLCFFILPCSRATEHGFDAEIPELDAYVKHEGDKFHILYRNAMSAAQTYTYKNHLTLIAQTYERVKSFVFCKEFVINQMGVAMYKITRMQQKSVVDAKGVTRLNFPDPPPIRYRSWHGPAVDSKYMITSYKLKSDMADPFRPESYVPYKFEVDRAGTDRIMEDALRMDEDMFTPQAIARRVRVYKTTAAQAGYSLVSEGYDITGEQFTHVVLLVYTKCFMQRYVQGITAAHVQGDTKTLELLQRKGALSLIPLVLRHVVFNNLNVGVSALRSYLIGLFVGWFKRPVQLPEIDMAPKYTTYSSSLEPDRFSLSRSWSRFFSNPWSGFSPYLTGYEVALAYSEDDISMDSYNERSLTELNHLLLEHISQSSTVSLDSADSSPRDLMSLVKSQRVAPTVATTVDNTQQWVNVDRITRMRGRQYTLQQVPRGPLVETADVADVAKKVTSDGRGLLDLRPQEFSRLVPLVYADPYLDAAGGIEANPIATLKTALGVMFPGSTLMRTESINRDVAMSDFQFVAKVAYMKLTSAKLAPGAIESGYRPAISNQMLPNVRQELVPTLHTSIKRNCNVTDSVEPLDVSDLWDVTWAHMKAVYYVTDVEDQLALMDYFGPSLEAAEVWASRLTPEARAVALNGNYCLSQLDDAMQNSKLMLKGKRKPNLGPSYDVAVKASQSIQFDGTKSRTGVFSPIFAEKVRRDQSLLRPNVFIMQSKSPADLNRFLSQFSWEPNLKGGLEYVMIDAEMFDKSQVYSTLMMHWKKCEKFKVLPEYVELLKANTSQRTASAIQAGIKLYLTPQRGSGDSDTLDGNCDVSQAVYAKFFHRIIDNIEFILIMGDDVTLGVRGDFDTDSVESDCMREFNLSVKLTRSKYGEFVSGWIVHMPDGTIQWHTDALKRAVSLGDQSMSKDTDFREKWEALADLCQGLSGHVVQEQTAMAIAARHLQQFSFAVDHSVPLSIVRSMATIANSEEWYRKLYSERVYKHI